MKTLKEKEGDRSGHVTLIKADILSNVLSGQLWQLDKWIEMGNFRK